MNTFNRFILLLSAFVITSELQAQLCQGSLGDPIINTTFGAGANPGAPLSAATTTYQYFSSDCPDDGFYAVRNSTSGCFGSNWHSIPADHTGDVNGYFMLVNATFQPSSFYLDTVKGLCGGTTYEFAAWVINVINPSRAPNSIEPDLTFSIEKTDGTILQTYNTKSINPFFSPTWKQFGFFFTTPAAVSNVVLRIFNNAIGGNGNDLGLDDITFRPCGPRLTSSITGYTTQSVTICEGTAQSFTFNGSLSAGFSNPSYQWQQYAAGSWTDIAGATGTIYTKSFITSTAAGNYVYRLTVAEAGNLNSPQCRVASPVVTIVISKNPVTTANSNSPVCSGNSLLLKATGGTQYTWSGPNGFSASSDTVSINNVQANDAGKYFVLVKNADGCSHLDSTSVLVNPSPLGQVSFSIATICNGDSLQLIASGGQIYEWLPSLTVSSPNSPAPIASPTQTTAYIVKVSNQFMCADTASVVVTVLPKPTADAGPDRVIIAGNPIELEANATGSNLTYSWINGLFINDPDMLRPMVNPKVDTKYILIVSTDNGCGIAEDSVNVKVYSGVYIPNAFTPNGDNINDRWNIPALAAFKNFELLVFNRYGQIVFSNSRSIKPWDGKYKGKDVPVGVYTYYIDLKTGNAVGKLKGTVLVIR